MRFIVLAGILITAAGLMAPAREDVRPADQPDPIGDLIRQIEAGENHAGAEKSSTPPAGDMHRNAYFMHDRPDREWLTRTVYGEARSQKAHEIKAIARIIINRWASGRWGSSMQEVVLAPAQFSCWNADDPNRPIVESVHVEKLPGWNRVRRLVDEAWREHRAGVPDPTRGALNYHHGAQPWWAKGAIPLTIGEAHTYRLTKK